MRVIAVILAAGSGERLGGGSNTPKQLIKLAGKTILEHTCGVFEAIDEIDEIIIVTREDLVPQIREIVSVASLSKVQKVIVGGRSRNESTQLAMDSLTDSSDVKVLFHDAVRPFLEARIVKDCISALDHCSAVDVAIPSADTIIETENDHIYSIPDRSRLRRGQTPQGFLLSVLRKAYSLADKDENFQATDDCGVIAKYLPDVAIKVIPGSESNIKITHPIDVYLADKLFQVRSQDLGDFSSAKIRNSLKGKELVIFGGSYGIGEAIAKLAKSLEINCHVLSRSLTGTHIEQYQSVCNALENIYAKTGRIDLVINTAGKLLIKPIHLLKEEELKELVDVNYMGAINIARASEQYLRQTKGHLLLFTSSSFTRGRAHYSIYSSCKAAVVNLTQALAEEWSHNGIQINCMNPERTLTPMRKSNFGYENPESLLDAETVAKHSLQAISSSLTGQVIDVRRQP